MNTYTISQNCKNKHLQFHHYEFIINELIKFNAEHANSRRNIGKTHFINHLASIVVLLFPIFIPLSGMLLLLSEIPISLNIPNSLL